MTTTDIRFRITLQLDPRVVLEGVMLNRLERIPKGRRQEWLRGLLVAGFKAECQVLRDPSENTKSMPVSTFGGWLARQAPSTPIASPTSESTPVTTADGPALSAKPFAHLRKVVG
ncbi:MAG: hypothetical protein KDI47_01510 [Gammaproteobacteria bacterium]|nr:hypothetical protein [Gammaproteobacteria bacterium]